MAAAEAVTVDAARMREEAPQLAALLKDMKNGLDELRTRIEALTAKVKADHFPTTHGITYLETKHLLLLNYCQSLVYYLLRKAKGLSIDGHPVVRSLVEIRLFLEKIRPIDKKLQFQLEKFTGVVGNFVEKNAVEKRPLTENAMEEAKEEDEWSKYRPNPDMLAPRKDATLEVGVYRPPKIAPDVMDEDKMSRQKRNALRKEGHAVRDAKNSAYLRELMNDLEGRPEEVREDIGCESREISRYK